MSKKRDWRRGASEKANNNKKKLAENAWNARSSARLGLSRNTPNSKPACLVTRKKTSKKTKTPSTKGIARAARFKKRIEAVRRQLKYSGISAQYRLNHPGINMSEKTREALEALV